jgi:SSS family solute:Na+ symporter
VLAFLVRKQAGDVLAGLLTAGILAAIMSSLDSQFLCLGTIFTNDIVVHYAGENRFTDKQKVVMARFFIVAIVAVTYLFSLAEPRRVFQMGVWCFSGFSGLFPLAFAAVYWRRLTAAGAYASVVAVIASWTFLFWKSGFGMIPNYSVDINIAGQQFHTMPVATIVLCSTLALIVVSLLTKPPGEATRSKFFPA